MAKEIERKFLLKNDSWRQEIKGEVYRQGYLSTDQKRTVRVRIIGRKGFLTIKSQSKGATRQEYEYPIPPSDAHEMLDKLCKRPLIEKTRYKIEYHGLIWEIDIFESENQGLTIAEVELEREDQTIDLPPWVGKEVTDDPRYFNANLIANPYNKWKT